jgi:hypothetical protein
LPEGRPGAELAAEISLVIKKLNPILIIENKIMSDNDFQSLSNGGLPDSTNLDVARQHQKEDIKMKTLEANSSSNTHEKFHTNHQRATTVMEPIIGDNNTNVLHESETITSSLLMQMLTKNDSKT